MPRELFRPLLKAFPVVSVALLTASAAASAASVSNNDEIDRTVTIVEGSAQTDHVLVPGAVLEGVCLRGCIVRIDGNDVDPYVLAGSEVTTIEGGDLFAEELGPSVSPGSGGAGQPSKPSPR